MRDTPESSPPEFVQPDYPDPVGNVSTTLDVSGGTSAISTEDLEVAAAQLATLAIETAAVSAVLAGLEMPTTPGTMYGDRARVDVELAVARLGEISHRVHLLGVVLRTAAQAYEMTEAVVASVSRAIIGVGAQAAAPLVSILLTPARLWLAGAMVGNRLFGGLPEIANAPFEKKGIPSAGYGGRANNHLWNNAVAVSVGRALAQSVGALSLGMLGAPPGVSQLLGTRAYEFGARSIAVAGRSVGLFTETPVKLVQTFDRPASGPPQGYLDRLERVAYLEDESGPQVVIERYSVPGEPDHYAVYVGGTVNFSPVATTEPWDFTSNLTNATGDESGSAASVKLAMEAAGITEESPVQFTGYSQGGGTAAQLVASGLYNTQGLTTFGGPTGQVDLPEGIPTVLVEHADDPVPALGGEQGNAGAVLVRRDVFEGNVTDKRYGVPSHHIEYYLQTAKLMDDSGSPQLDSTLAELDSFTAGATLESSTAYRFERAPSDKP